MLSIRNGVRRFPNGVLALDNIVLDVHKGDFLVLLGPSGCGKSTLLRLIAGLDELDAGTLVWEPRRPGHGSIGFVFQDHTLLPWATALQNVALPLRLRGDPDALAKATASLTRVGLKDFRQARPSQLSGGMKMRVSIARALVSRPSVLLMDEPFAALDELTRHRLQDELLDLTSELGCTTVFVTHSLYEAAYLASRVIIMTPRPGRIAEEVQKLSPATRQRLGPDYLQRIARLTERLRTLEPEEL